jgi:hypothetical protein
VGIRRADHVAPSIRKELVLTSPTSGGRSVGIVRSRTQATEFFFTEDSSAIHGLCLVNTPPNLPQSSGIGSRVSVE